MALNGGCMSRLMWALEKLEFTRRPAVATFLVRCAVFCIAIQTPVNQHVLAAQQLNFPPEPQLAMQVQWKVPSPEGPVPRASLSQATVATPNLELTIHGPCKNPSVGEAQVLGVPGSIYPMNIWTGHCPAPIAVTLRDTRNLLDLTGQAQIEWMARSHNLHSVRPVLRLADGTLIVGSHADTTPRDRGPYAFPGFPLVRTAFALAPLDWYKLDPNTLGTMSLVERPDLSKVDAIGFVDLMPAGGEGDAGWINVGEIKVYGKKVPR